MGNSKVRWLPLADGRYEWENSVGDNDVYLRVSNKGQTLEQWSDHWSNSDQADEIDFGWKNFRLCQSVPDEGITSEIAETIRMGLELLASDIELAPDSYFDTIHARLAAAREWLQTQTKGGG